MEVVSKKRGKDSRNGVVVASCVWENRMRFDEFKGGMNVYSEKEETPQVENDEMKTNEVEEDKKLEMGSKTNLGVGCFVMSGKRKTWKSESNSEGNPIEISTKRSQLCKELSVSAMKRSPIQSKKREGNEKMSEMKKVKNVSPNGNLRNSLQPMKAKSEECQEIVLIEENKVVGVSKRNLERVFSGSSDGNEENKVVVDESKMNLERVFVESSDGNEENKVVDVCDESKRNLERVFSESSDENEVVVNESKKNLEMVFVESSDENEVVDVLDESKRNLERVFVESSDGDEENKVVDELKKNVNGNEWNQIQLRKVKSEANKAQNMDGKNCDLRKVKSMCLNGNLKNSLQIVKTKTEKCNKSFEKNKVLEENCEEKLNLENEDFKILEEEVEKENSLAKEIKTKKIVIVEEKKVHTSNNEKKQMSISPIIKKQSIPSFSGQSRTLHHHSNQSRTKPVPVSDEYQRNIPRQHSKLASLADLVMWTDTSKSALIFGIGTFFIISSSYTKDLNIREANDIGESSEYVLGEEEAMWLLKLILPYINEFLMKIRALFSGDPATTMKMAILLFIFARCGSSITIWKMSKLGFFGVFIVPKVCSSYSTQLTAYGTFWIRRFRDAWESCTHKKAVAFAIFTLIWNLSSISARIWAVFVLYVGFRYYQQKMMKEGWIDEEEITKSEDYWQERQKRIERKKQKKTI